MIEKTTIKISIETKKRLDNLKEFERESYEEIIKKVLYLLNLLKKDPSESNEALERINSNIKRRLFDIERKIKEEKKEKAKNQM